MARQKSPGGQLALFPGAPGTPEAEAETPKARMRVIEPAPVSPEVEALGRALPEEIRLGPSTWSYPGWEGLVYDGPYSVSRLAREGLAACARHPLLRAMGIDRTHYSPVEAAELAAYAADVPPGFRFLVKAHEALTLARFPDRPRYGRERGLGNPLYLDAAYAADAVVAPYALGLGEKGGGLLFQFAPQDLGGPARFADELGTFLSALPRGPLYAVELRNRELLTPRYAEVLAATGAVHCINAYPRMPDVRTQARLAGVASGPAVLVRWLLRAGKTYEEAARLFAPFDRLHEEDPATREALAELSRDALGRGQPVLITVNNQAEGSAPLSIGKLAEAIVEATRTSPT
ncbi:MAG TPA: DUF72 domain-containing protein [Thermoanaerobaculia bacterium]|nr:DUF72 domain-containing protein [Thermoanaerobaculia bacterium]